MDGEEIKGLIDSFLFLVREGGPTPESNEVVLAALLDRLALASHSLDTGVDETDYPDPPGWPYEDRRKIISSRFPRYGYYNLALPVSESIGEAEVVVGDAIDDLADIAGDLEEATWRWQNTSPRDALWHLGESYRHHGGKHLRGLQWYLIHLKDGE